MSEPNGGVRPAWQTDELEDEWPDEDERTHSSKQQTLSTQAGTQNFRGTLNLLSIRRTETLRSNMSGQEAVGTVVVRDDAPPMGMPQTPGKAKKGAMKDIFSPLALEKMFEPPSPPDKSPPSNQAGPSKSSPPLGLQQHISTKPAKPSKLSQVMGASVIAEEEEDEEEIRQGDEVLETDMPDFGGIGGRKPGAKCQFTFAVGRQPSALPVGVNPSTQDQLSEYLPQAQSTPIPPSQSQLLPHPSTDPRLRLFQFNYDTYTRDHLSALVDSFGVSPKSGSSHSSDKSTPLASRNSQGADQPGRDESFSRFRSTKRIKLTPPSQLCQGDDGHKGEVEIRPVLKKDYIGESQNLMQQIRRRARDFSMMSAATQDAENPPETEAYSMSERRAQQALSTNVTNTHLQIPPYSRPPSAASTSSTSNTNAKGSKYSSLALRAEANDLMAKIKSDMANKRLFSERTEKSFISHLSDEPNRSSDPSPEEIPVVANPMSCSDDEGDKENGAPPPYVPDSSGNRPIYSPRRLLKSSNREREKSQSMRTHFDERPIVMPIEIPLPYDPFAKDPSPQERVRSPNPTFLAPPSRLHGTQLPQTVSTNEDLNRFVSSSTTATGTTLHGGSTGSFVKHAGAPQMVHIGPADLPQMPDRVGKMVYDPDLMRWVKERQASHEAKMGVVHETSEGVNEGESDDPFRDIESLRDDDSSRRTVQADDEAPVDHSVDMILDCSSTESDSVFDDDEEADLSTFTFDDPASGIVQVMTGADDFEQSADDASDSDFSDDFVSAVVDEGVTEELASMSISQVQHTGSFALATAVSPDGVRTMAFSMQATVTPIPSEKRAVYPPRSALKSASVTPMQRTPGTGHRRSVSFSDGRKEGQIIGLARDVANGFTSTANANGSLMPSARTRRIADAFANINASGIDDTPLKGSQTGRRAIPSIRPLDRDVSESSNDGLPEVSHRSFQRSQSTRDIHASPRRKFQTSTHANATFLTECSFGVAHDRLVQVITDVQPFEPYWEALDSIDLSCRRIDSVARLKEFLPKLDSLHLDENLLCWLSGVPGTVRTLSVASNALTSLTSYAHLPNLENLDISNNDIDSLKQLQCLRHLRELRADGNKVTSISGIEDMDGLVKLSLQGNKLKDLDLESCRWKRLEILNLSCNRLVRMTGLGGLTALISLNLDNNSLTCLDSSQDTAPISLHHSKNVHPAHSPSPALQKLRVLRLSGNRLKYLDVERFPNLRTLYLDNNCLAEPRKHKQSHQRLINLCRLGKLENFSARNQSGGGSRDAGLYIESDDICDVKRLYLSGNPSPFPRSSSTHSCYNLVYLEMAACRLTALPANFSALVPNLRVLNMNYNFFETDDVVDGLEGLNRLRKLTVVGSRMTGTKALIRMLSSMGGNMEMLDFRMNPCTLGWYLPLLVQDKDAPAALLQPSEIAATSPLNDDQLESDSSPETLGGSWESSARHSNPSGKHGHRPSREIGSAQAAGIVTEDKYAEAIPLASGSTTRSGPTAVLSKGSASAAMQTHWQGQTSSQKGPSRWESLDAEFRKGLPDATYVWRLAYRGMVMRVCPKLRILDGVRVGEKERRKAEAILNRAQLTAKHPAKVQQ